MNSCIAQDPFCLLPLELLPASNWGGGIRFSLGITTDGSSAPSFSTLGLSLVLGLSISVEPKSISWITLSCFCTGLNWLGLYCVDLAYGFWRILHFDSRGTIGCYAPLCLSHNSQESSFVDSHTSFFGSLRHHEHMPCTCPIVLLLFCLCVRWTPCLVLNPPFHNSKIPLLKTGYITSNYLILQKKSRLLPQPWKLATASLIPLSSTTSAISMIVWTTNHPFIILIAQPCLRSPSWY